MSLVIIQMYDSDDDDDSDGDNDDDNDDTCFTCHRKVLRSSCHDGFTPLSGV